MSIRIVFGLNKLDQRLKHAPERILLLRDGDLGWDGFDGKLTPKSAAAIIQTFELQGTQLPIDYHHTTLKVDRGQTDKAPAAGWIKSLEYVPGKGLYAEIVEWNEEAATQIERREYKYLSPVVTYEDDTNELLTLHSVALTNKPRTKDQIELLQAAERLDLRLNQWSNDMPSEKKPDTKTMAAEEHNDETLPAVNEDQMLMSKMIAVLQEKGAQLADNAPITEVLRAALDVLGADVAGNPEDEPTEEEASKKMDDKTKSAAIPADVALKAAAFDGVNGRLKILEAERTVGRVDRLIEAQIEAGKILPDDADVITAARVFAEKDEESFTKLYSAMAPICEPGKTVHSAGASAGTGRARIIKAASAEWAGDEKAQRACGEASWVNQDLRDRSMPILASSERNALSKE